MYGTPARTNIGHNVVLSGQMQIPPFTTVVRNGIIIGVNEDDLLILVEIEQINDFKTGP